MATGVLKNGANEQIFFRIIDSGADFTTIPLPIAEMLDLDLEKSIGDIHVAGVAYAGHLAHCDIIFSARKEKHIVSNVPIDVIEAPPGKDYPPILIGRAGIFSRFTITFKEKDLRVYFKKETEKAY